MTRSTLALLVGCPLPATLAAGRSDAGPRSRFSWDRRSDAWGCSVIARCLVSVLVVTLAGCRAPVPPIPAPEPFRISVADFTVPQGSRTMITPAITGVPGPVSGLTLTWRSPPAWIATVAATGSRGPRIEIAPDRDIAPGTYAYQVRADWRQAGSPSTETPYASFTVTVTPRVPPCPIRTLPLRVSIPNRTYPGAPAGVPWPLLRAVACDFG